MMDHLPNSPAALAIRGIELLVGQAGNRPAHPAWETGNGFNVPGAGFRGGVWVWDEASYGIAGISHAGTSFIYQLYSTDIKIKLHFR
jgi:hypothetical protein